MSGLAGGPRGAAGASGSGSCANGRCSTNLGTLNNAAYTVITGVSVTFDPGAAVNALITAYATGLAGGVTAQNFFDVSVDGTQVPGSELAFVMAATLGVAYAMTIKVALTSASHTIAVRSKQAGGATLALNASTGGHGAGLSVVYPVT